MSGMALRQQATLAGSTTAGNGAGTGAGSSTTSGGGSSTVGGVGSSTVGGVGSSTVTAVKPGSYEALEQNATQLQKEVLVLRKRLSDLHGTDIHHLRTAYNSIAQHVLALESEAMMVAHLVDGVETEFFDWERVSEEMTSAGGIGGLLFLLHRLAVQGIPVVRTLEGRVLWLGGIYVVWRVGALAFNRFHSMLQRNREVQQAMRKELAAVQQRINIMHDLTKWTHSPQPSNTPLQPIPDNLTSPHQLPRYTTGLLNGNAPLIAQHKPHHMRSPPKHTNNNNQVSVLERLVALLLRAPDTSVNEPSAPPVPGLSGACQQAHSRPLEAFVSPLAGMFDAITKTIDEKERNVMNPWAQQEGMSPWTLQEGTNSLALQNGVGPHRALQDGMNPWAQQDGMNLWAQQEGMNPLSLQNGVNTLWAQQNGVKRPSQQDGVNPSAPQEGMNPWVQQGDDGSPPVQIHSPRKAASCLGTASCGGDAAMRAQGGTPVVTGLSRGNNANTALHNPGLSTLHAMHAEGRAGAMPTSQTMKEDNFAMNLLMTVVDRVVDSVVGGHPGVTEGPKGRNGSQREDSGEDLSPSAPPLSG